VVNKQFYYYQTVVRKQAVVHLIPLFKNFFNPFSVGCYASEESNFKEKLLSENNFH
jgi:hypothetical protein